MNSNTFFFFSSNKAISRTIANFDPNLVCSYQSGGGGGIGIGCEQRR